ncbi:MAG: PulJ/GspJ family protein [Candidatus Omnitrophota bacterium]
MKRSSSDSGYTVVEVMFASMIAVMLFGGIYQVVFVIDRARYEQATNIDLTTRAHQVLDKMILGIRQAGTSDRRGLNEAILATVTATQIDYTDTNAVVHSIRLDNGNIEYRRGAAGAWVLYFDPNGALAYDPAVYSTSLAFSQTNPRAVKIDLVLGRQIKGRWHYASFSTQASFRNA